MPFSEELILPSFNIFAGAVKRAFRLFGIELGRERHTLAAKRREVLRSQAITLVLDVGANAGQYAQELRGSGYTGAIVSFEPVLDAYRQLEAKTRLREHNWQCVRTALGASIGEITMNVSQASVASSVFAFDHRLDGRSDLVMVVKEKAPMTTLDEACRVIATRHRNIYLKIDTQGYELEVLKGGRELLNSVRAVELELTLAPVYRGQPLLPEVWAWLQQCGFRPIWIERGFLDPKTGYMLQADAIFTQEPK